MGKLAFLEFRNHDKIIYKHNENHHFWGAENAKIPKKKYPHRELTLTRQGLPYRGPVVRIARTYTHKAGLPLQGPGGSDSANLRSQVRASPTGARWFG